jgi:L-serine dehydratase
LEDQPIEAEGNKQSRLNTFQIASDSVKYETGMDMQSRYKETSLAGLALNVIEC